MTRGCWPRRTGCSSCSPTWPCSTGPQRDPERERPRRAPPQEHLLSYLQWLDADRAGLPTSFRAAARAGARPLRRDRPRPHVPQLEEAVVWMWRSFRRADELDARGAPSSSNARLHRRRGRCGRSPGRTCARCWTGSAATARPGYPDVADLARDVRVPLLRRAAARPRRRRRSTPRWTGTSTRWTAEPRRPTGAARVARLVWCPQPMRACCCTAGPTRRPRPAARSCSRCYLRRFYRIRALRDVRVRRAPAACSWAPPTTSTTAAACTSSSRTRRWPTWPPSLAPSPRHLRDVPEARRLVVDLATWRPDPRRDADEMAGRLRELLRRLRVRPRPCTGVDVTVTSEARPPSGALRTQHFTFRPRPTAFAEELRRTATCTR